MSESESYWRLVLADWRSSTLSLSAFCREEGLSYSTANYWKRRIGPGPARRAPASASPQAIASCPAPASTPPQAEAPSRRPTPRAAPFVEVAASTQTASAGWPASANTESASAVYRIDLKCGRVLRLGSPFDPTEVARLIEAVESCS